MPVTKRTRDQLNIRNTVLKGMGVSVRFDRPRGEVIMTKLAGLIPFGKTVLPLEEIVGAQVRKVERNGGRVTYGVVLRRRSTAADVSFDCSSRDDAMVVRREISSFLEIHTDEPEQVPAALPLETPNAA